MSYNEKIFKSIIEDDDVKFVKLCKSRLNITDARYSIEKIHRFSNETVTYCGNRGQKERKLEDQIPKDNLTLLHVAAYFDSLKCFTYLHVEKGMDVGLLNYDGYMPLHYACWAGSSKVASYTGCSV